ncbi:MAG TPA: cytochrome d ubiquinol oxidase subunit II [Polyangiales bacterium]|nr:cytochrome d ubiquinol oxidase subunit II [Polyangiales bacterium]
MAEFLLAVMLVAAALYTVLGGADFGAGIMEGFMGKKARERVDVALAPVWEANHVWLVLIVVIAFVGFPRLYTLVSLHLHIPVLLVLLGIVARGSAFTFRHYDPTSAFDTSYSVVFRAASVLTPLSLGLIVAATAAERIPLPGHGGFYEQFIAPWNSAFGWATGVFVCALFAFEGAALLAAEHVRDDAPLPYLRSARRAHFATIASGAIVLLVAYAQDLPWLRGVLHSPFALTAMGVATLLIFVVAYAFHAGRPWVLRLAMGAQATCVLLGFFAAQFPVLLRTEAADLTYTELAASPATLRGLVWAVAIGLLVIVPLLAYLIAVYKGGRNEPLR